MKQRRTRGLGRIEERAFYRKIVELYALSLGATDIAASKLAHESMSRFSGVPLSAELAEEVYAWVALQIDEDLNQRSGDIRRTSTPETGEKEDQR